MSNNPPQRYACVTEYDFLGSEAIGGTMETDKQGDWVRWEAAQELYNALKKISLGGLTVHDAIVIARGALDE